MLEKGKAAPYTGVLVPEDAYRFYQKDSILFPDCKERLDAVVLESQNTPEPWIKQNTVLTMLACTLLGFFVGAHYGN